MEESFLTSEEKEILVKAANLMDELIETLEVMQDEELIQDLKDAMREVKEPFFFSLHIPILKA